MQIPQIPTYYPEVDCAATSFRFEREMVKPLLVHLHKAFLVYPGQRMCLLREEPIGSVIPDLMLGIWSGELPRLSGLNTVSRHILAWLSSQKVANSKEELREDLFLSRHAVDCAVSTLQRIGAISKRDSGELELRPEFEVSSSIRLIAIEMKLKRWREALEQAIEYRKFADEAYVVLDGSQLRMNCIISDAFVTTGIGLFLQRGDELENVMSATPTVPSLSVDRVFAVGKLAASGPYCLA